MSAILAGHKKTITCIAWNPKDPDLLATASTDCCIYIWSVPQQKVINTLGSTKGAPVCIGWCPHEPDSVAYVYGRGPLYIWNPSAPEGGVVSKYLDGMSFFSDICQFRWNQRKLVFGHADGSISLMCPGQKVFKHYLRPVTVQESDDEDPVTCLEWDPLSVDYLLICNAHHGIRLIDTNSMSTIMHFNLPSSASRIHTLAWIPSAPGVFVTGGKGWILLADMNLTKLLVSCMSNIIIRD